MQAVWVNEYDHVNNIPRLSSSLTTQKQLSRKTQNSEIKLDAAVIYYVKRCIGPRM